MSRGTFAEAESDALRRQLSYLARSASIELTPREITQSAPYRRLLSPGSQVYIPHVPAARVSDVVAAARALTSDGMIAIPHIAARRLRSELELDDLLDQLRDAGCRQLLLIGGGVSRPAGPFASALAILRSGKLERAGFRRIGIAGHPEGSPDIDSATLRDAYREKSRLAETGAFEMYIVTQFCFEALAVLAWERELRALGNRLPVHVGMAGVTSGAKLLRFAAICGVKASAGFLRHGGPSLGRLLTRWSPGAMVLDIASHTIADRDSMIRQLHFFPFGGFPATVEWLKAVGNGHYAFRRNEEGVRLVVEEETS